MPQQTTESPYYFAYGSNLNEADWRQYCARVQVKHDVIEAVGTAVLPDMQLCFDYFSGSRGGGALNIRPARGHIVHGVLFRASSSGWSALDGKEGAPYCYEQVQRAALMPDGSQVPVITYEVTDMMRRDFCPPSAEYRQIVADGLKAWGLPAAGLERAADNRAAKAEIDRIFVYGTLMRDEHNAPLIPESLILELRYASVRGLLYDTGFAFPALALPNDEHDIVQGECLQIAQMPTLLETLDTVEGFYGYGDTESLYYRTLTQVCTRDNKQVRAWCYIGARPETLHRRIKSGCWRTHCSTTEI